MGGTTSCLVVVKEGFGHRKLDIFVEIKHVEGRHPVSVGRFMMDEEGKRLRLVAILEELYGMIRNEFRGIALLFDVLPSSLFRTETRVVIVALARENMVVVEAFRLTKHVPFAYHTRLITSLLQVFAHERRVLVDRTVKGSLSALVAIHASHQAGSAGGAEGVLDISTAEEHSSLGKPVEIGRRSLSGKLVSVGTNCLIGMVVAHDVDDVPTLCLSTLHGTTAKEKEGKFLHDIGFC